MKKIKESIIENWKHYIAILLVSVSIVCILVDIVQIFNINYICLFDYLFISP